MIKSFAAFTAFLVMIFSFLWYVGSLGIRVSPPADRINLSMDVLDVNNLVAQSNVVLRGVPVGKVSRIDASASNATVHFYIDGKYRIPADSVVRLENLSALGESYLEVQPRSAGGALLRDGQLSAAREGLRHRPAGLLPAGLRVLSRTLWPLQGTPLRYGIN